MKTKATFRLICLLALSLISFAAAAQGPQTIIQVPIAPARTEGAILYLPDDYATSSTHYPIIVFLHGIGEGGTNPATIYNSSTAGGPAYYIAHGQWPSSTINPSDGLPYKFIVVSPQNNEGWSTTAPELDYVLSYLINNYRVDTTRLYLTGLSAGGEGITEYVAKELGSGTYINPSHQIAAYVPMSAVVNGGHLILIADTVVADNVRIWGFGSPTDTHGQNTLRTVGYVNQISPGYGVSTSYTGGHCCWGQFYNPTFTQSVNGKTMNIYQWMLMYKRTYTATTAPVNKIPVVNAGTDATITLPTSSYQIAATASDPDGSIAKYAWTKTAGPTAFTISNTAILNPVMSGLTAGIYTFRLTVTDNSGATAYNDINITVNSAAVNKIPVVNAGTDATVTSPTSSYQIAATASDPDGTIAKYAWTKTAGPTAFTISNAAILSPLISGLVAGTYTFRLTVTDNSGATAFDDINITVNSALSGTTAKTLNVSIYGGTNPYQDTHWNNWNVVTGAIPSVNIVSGKFNYDDGSASTISTTLSRSQTVADNGAAYGGGMAPAQVLRYVSYSSTDRTLTLSGLTIGNTYDISLYSSRANPNDPTKFTVGSLSTTIATYDNLTNKVTFTSLLPDTKGNIVVNIMRTASFSYINGFTIIENSGTASTSQPEVLSDITEVTAETTESAAFTIYPNPVMDQFTVRLNNPIIGEMDIRLLSMSGQLIERYHAVKDQDVFSQTCYLKNIPKGTYVVDVKIGHLWSRAKVITKL